MTQKKTPLPLKLFPQLWLYLAPYKGALLGSFCMMVLAASIIFAFGFGLRQLIDEGFSARNPDLLDQSFLIFLSASLVLALAAYGRTATTAWLAERVVHDLRQKLFAHLLTLDQSFFDGARVGDLLSRLNTDTALLHTLIRSSAAVAIRSLIQFIGGAVMLLITSPWLTGLVFLVVPVVLLPIGLLGRKLRHLTKQTQDYQGNVAAYTEENLSAIQSVQSFNHESSSAQFFKDLLTEKMTLIKRRVHVRSLLIALVISFIGVAISTVMWIGSHQVFEGGLTAGDLSAFVFYAIVVAGSLNSLAEVLGDLNAAAGAGERIFELFITPSLITNPKHPKIIDLNSNPLITFRNVTFYYPTRPETPALEDFSLTVSKGETLAIVGPSGAGKSTAFHLLLRFYDPQEGDVTLGAVSLKDTTLENLRQSVGFVPQEPVIFNTTLEENIRYGLETAKKQEIAAAAKAAFVDEFVDRLPKGYKTPVGERGVRLSGGQKQRISLARVLLKDPPILLLDEATNALDAESEHRVQQALETLKKGRTTLVIAHRLATVLKADRILVMDQGKIVEEGRHEDLLKKEGLYRRLAEKQFDLREI